MSVGVTSAILASIVCLTVAVTILFKRPRRTLYGYFSAFTFSLFLWHAAALASQITVTTVGQIQTIAALFIPPTAVLFFRDLLRHQLPVGRRMLPATLAASGLLLLLNFSPFGSYLVVRIGVMGYVGISLLLLARAMHDGAQHARSDVERKRLRYLLFGGITALILAGGALIPGVGLTAALGHLAVTFYVYFLYQSIIARRLIDVGELLGKAAVLLLLTLVLASVYSLLVLWVGADEPSLWLFNTLVASFVILILYDQVRPWVEETTAKLLFRERQVLRTSVHDLLRALRTTINTDEMCVRTLGALHNSGRAPHAAIYLPAESDLSFALRGFRGARPPENLSVSEQPTLLQELRRERRPVLLEHLQHRFDELPTPLTDDDPTAHRELERLEEAVSAMLALHANIMIPMLTEERIVGILLLGLDPGADPYSADELATLLSVGEACAVVIENSQEYEKLRERDRLVAVGEMAAGMAHEIRNPLGAIKGAAQCLDPTQMPAASNELLEIIVEEVDRLNSVVEQFLEYARPYRGNPTPTQVNDVVIATLKLLGRDAVPSNIELTKNLAHDLPVVPVDPEQLKQVLINLVLNAIQAMPDGGKISVESSVTHEQTGDLTGEAERCVLNTWVLLKLRDSGSGIRPEDLQRIFVPFFTTKDQGTGLGLAISQRIIENAGGRLEVHSRVGEGTTFTIRLLSGVEEEQPTEALSEPLPTEEERETIH